MKTTQFVRPIYVGDPRNAVRIFNEKEVDEIAILDIDATRTGAGPDLRLLEEIVTEAFMPVAYGGGIKTLDEAKRIVSLGVEKVVVNTHAVRHPGFVRELADELGSQSVVASLDVAVADGGFEVSTRNGAEPTGCDPRDLARQLAHEGAGEILVQSIDRDGMMSGYDLTLVDEVARSVQVPVVACGGAGSLDDVTTVLRETSAAAAAAGSMFVFHGRHKSVLISYPEHGSWAIDDAR